MEYPGKRVSIQGAGGKGNLEINRKAPSMSPTAGFP